MTEDKGRTHAEQEKPIENMRGELDQNKLEYWKAQYDFQKHLMTLGVAGAAGLAALLGGVFSGEDPWGISYFFGHSDRVIVIGNYLATAMILLGFAGFLLCAFFANFAARSATLIIRNHSSSEGSNGEERFESPRKKATIFLSAGLLISLAFICSNFIGYQFR